MLMYLLMGQVENTRNVKAAKRMFTMMVQIDQVHPKIGTRVGAD